MKIVSPIFNDAAGALGANLEVVIDHEALTETTNATAQVIELFPIDASYEMVELIRAELQIPFEDTADAGNNTTAIEVGDDGDTDRLLVSMELNRNGSEVYIKAGTGVKYVYGADNTVDIKFLAAASGKNLAAINKGRLRLLFRKYDSRG